MLRGYVVAQHDVAQAGGDRFPLNHGQNPLADIGWRVHECPPKANRAHLNLAYLNLAQLNLAQLNLARLASVPPRGAGNHCPGDVATATTTPAVSVRF